MSHERHALTLSMLDATRGISRGSSLDINEEARLQSEVSIAGSWGCRAQTPPGPTASSCPRRAPGPEAAHLLGPCVPGHGHGKSAGKPCAWFWSSGCLQCDCMNCQLSAPDGIWQSPAAREALETTFSWRSLRPRSHCGQHHSMTHPDLLHSEKLGQSIFKPPGTGGTELNPTAETLGLGRVPMESIGSVLHSQGLCKPCAWYWKPQSCENGRHCLHCHLCGADEPRRRRKQKKEIKRAVLRDASRGTHLAESSALNDSA
mmetsp:Transcript_44002/g.102687  ORF Transcript_44002/g.102687 Transcript_44002/m.102687 type:complete len:260 (-) Transcript_44002:121-900(-)